MCKFDGIDGAANPKPQPFWASPDLLGLNRRIRGAHEEDLIGRPGVTLVIGCPTTGTVQRSVLEVQRELANCLVELGLRDVIEWRKRLDALHITTYGIVKPDDYDRRASWEKSGCAVQALSSQIADHLGFRLKLQGLAVLGRGALAIRVSDSNELSGIRALLAAKQQPGISAPSTGEAKNVNQMIVGRVRPVVDARCRDALSSCLLQLLERHVDDFEVNALELVHYRHEFLDSVFEQKTVP